MLKTEALEAGYVPCDCALDVTIHGEARVIHGGVVYYCPDYGEVYHGYNCPYLEQCNEVATTFIWNTPHIETGGTNGNGLRPCDKCGGKPLEDEED